MSQYSDSEFSLWSDGSCTTVIQDSQECVPKTTEQTLNEQEHHLQEMVTSLGVQLRQKELECQRLQREKELLELERDELKNQLALAQKQNSATATAANSTNCIIPKVSQIVKQFEKNINKSADCSEGACRMKQYATKVAADAMLEPINSAESSNPFHILTLSQTSMMTTPTDSFESLDVGVKSVGTCCSSAKSAVVTFVESFESKPADLPMARNGTNNNVSANSSVKSMVQRCEILQQIGTRNLVQRMRKRLENDQSHC